MLRFSILAMFAVACGGGAPAAKAPQPGLPGGATPENDPLPAVHAEAIGVPGDPVPGLNAYYVTTMPGWLSPQGDVVFEAVIQWKPDNTLGCGILRRAPDGNVNPLLMQGQPLPGTGGVVKHPKLPIESRGDTLVMPADVEGGSVAHALFAVPRAGGAPVLLAEGPFSAAVFADDGSVLAQRGGDLLRVVAGATPEVLCTGCEPGFSTDGARAVVRRAGAAWAVGLDGAMTRIAGFGDAVPETAGTITLVRGAWVNDAGAFVVHADTSDPDCPEALLRFAGGVEVLAVCGGPAPGTTDTIERIRVAHGRSDDVVFAAGTASSGAVVYCARPGEAPVPVAFSGGDFRIREAEVVVDGERIAFGAVTQAGEEIHRVGPGAGAARILFTDASVPAAGGATLAAFTRPLPGALDVASDGRALVHAGLVEERRPGATLGALLLVP